MSDQRYVVSGETMYTNIKENIILETRLKFIYYLISYILFIVIFLEIYKQLILLLSFILFINYLSLFCSKKILLIVHFVTGTSNIYHNVITVYKNVITLVVYFVFVHINASWLIYTKIIRCFTACLFSY